jgi:lipid II:glycine glycyltransferase (peptidoglycan interpeptide bridge formation enzyme)
MNETTDRDSFSWNSYEYYCKFLNSIPESKLMLSYVNENVVAAWIFLFDREVSIYYYWASTSKKKYRNLMAPYQLQWEAIKIAKSSWGKFYDFLWVANPDSKNDPLSGVTSFKRKLTPDIRHVSESYIWINSIILYTLLKLIKKCKSLIK